MSAMWQVIVKNNSASDIAIDDLGISIPANSNIDLSLQYSFDTIAGSDSLRDLVSAGQLVINNGTTDLSATDGVNFLKLSTIKYLLDNFFTRTQLNTAGQSTIDWNNITNVPSFGSVSWGAPVKYRVRGINLSTAPSSPVTGDIYVDNTSHARKYNGSTWTDLGVVTAGTRVINLASATQNIFSFNGTTWTDLGIPTIDSGVMLEDDGDGKQSQYVYGSDSTWKKIGDVDFSGHMDSGPDKHKASQITVENAYARLGSLSGDNLESVLSKINSVINGLDLINSLDQAYDDGGPGVGRVITVDTGAVKLDSTPNTYAPLELTERESAPSTGLAAGQLVTIAGMLYIYDAVRGKWLSVFRQLLVFGRAGATRNQFLNFGAGSLPSNNSGIRIGRNACIIGMCAQCDVAVPSIQADFQIMKNDITTAISTLTVPASQLGASDVSLNVNINANDFLQAYLSKASGAGVDDPMLTVEIAYRP